MNELIRGTSKMIIFMLLRIFFYFLLRRDKTKKNRVKAPFKYKAPERKFEIIPLFPGAEFKVLKAWKGIEIG